MIYWLLLAGIGLWWLAKPQTRFLRWEFAALLSVWLHRIVTLELVYGSSAYEWVQDECGQRVEIIEPTTPFNAASFCERVWNLTAGARLDAEREWLKLLEQYTLPPQGEPVVTGPPPIEYADWSNLTH